MTERQRIQEWARWYEIASPGYQVNALLAVLKNDGEPMLRKVLRELKLELTADLLMAMVKP